MLTELKTLIERVNPNYIVEYEEASMMNIKADEYSRGTKFAYIEEFVQGAYTKDKYVKQKTTQMQVYFCAFAVIGENGEILLDNELHTTAEKREEIRNQIESEIVLPFMEAYNDSGIFERVDKFKFYTPLRGFDANEVSIMLQFDCKVTIC